MGKEIRQTDLLKILMYCSAHTLHWLGLVSAFPSFVLGGQSPSLWSFGGLWQDSTDLLVYH